MILLLGILILGILMQKIFAIMQFVLLIIALDVSQLKAEKKMLNTLFQMVNWKQRKMNSKEALEKLSYIPIYEEDEHNIITDINNCCVYKGDLYEIYGNEVDTIEKDLEILEEYRKIEEELGIELTVLFSALKYGVYYLEDNCQRVYDNVSLISNYISTGPHDKLSYSFITHNTRQILLFDESLKLGGFK